MENIYGETIKATFGVARELIDSSLSRSFGNAKTKNYYYINTPILKDTEGVIYQGIFETNNIVWCMNSKGEKKACPKEGLERVVILRNNA